MGGDWNAMSTRDLQCLRVGDVARLLRVSRRTVYRMIGRRQLPVIHVGRAVRVPESAVRALVSRAPRPAS